MINRIKGDQRGMTLTETLIALAIFGIVGASVMFALNASSKTIISAHEITTSESLTRSLIEHIKRADYDSTVAITILNEDIEDTDTSDDDIISVDEADDLPDATTDDPQVIQIEQELIQYTGKSGDTLTGCTRGYAGTAIAGHADGTTIIASPLYYDDDLHSDICQAAGINLTGDPYFGEYTVETGILRLDVEDDGYDNDDSLQKIYVLIRYQGRVALTTESYKVNR